MLKDFAIIGGGSWGTAIACLVSRAVGSANLYTLEEDVAREINDKYKNSKYLGDTELPNGVKATTKITDIIGADVIIIAAPSIAFLDVIAQLKKNHLPKNTILLIATKGLCENPVQLFSERIEAELANPYALISGPNFAKEAALGKYTSVIIAGKNITLAEEIAHKLASENLNTGFSDDIITVQVSSIVKNIAAIKSGIIQAQGAGENAKAWLISKALEEVSIIAKALGGNIENLTLPSVVGDLVLTCYSTTSRNTKFGYEFHQNNYSQDFLDNYPILVEGIASARLLKSFLKERGLKLELPIVSSIIDIV